MQRRSVAFAVLFSCCFCYVNPISSARLGSRSRGMIEISLSWCGAASHRSVLRAGHYPERRARGRGVSIVCDNGICIRAWRTSEEESGVRSSVCTLCWAPWAAAGSFQRNGASKLGARVGIQLCARGRAFQRGASAHRLQRWSPRPDKSCDRLVQLR